MAQPHFGSRRQETPVVYHSAYDRNLKPGVRFGPLIRDIYIIECNTGGYGSVIINDREFPVRPGDCYILLPGDTVTHTADLTEPRQGVWCSVDGMQVGMALAQAGITSENPYAPPELFGELTAQIDAIAQMQGAADPGADLRRTGHMYTFLGILLRAANAQQPSHWLNRVMGFMESNYYLPIGVAELAREACLERSYFSVRFREVTGQTPHSYLTALRIRKACALMTKTGCSVASAAELVGLDSRNFARLFKRQIGQTPSQYLRAPGESGQEKGS